MDAEKSVNDTQNFVVFRIFTHDKYRLELLIKRFGQKASSIHRQADFRCVARRICAT